MCAHTHTQQKEMLGVIHFSDESDPIFLLFDYKISNTFFEY